MPKLTQPERLETLALQSLAVWLSELGEQLMTITDCPNIIKSYVDTLNRLFDYNVPCYLFDRLREEIFRTVPISIERIKSNIVFGSPMNIFLNQCKIAVSLTEVLVSSKLRKLCFDKTPKMVRHLFYKKLSGLKGLEYLDLGSMSGGWKTVDLEPTIIKGLNSMNNLRILILNYDCTDNILNSLHENCPNLHTIDLSSSKLVTNDSIDILIKNKKLRNVELYRTAVTLSGYINIFMNLKTLENIGQNDEIGLCLEYIQTNYPQLSTFKLKKFVSSYVTSSHLQYLSEMCPLIESISLFHNSLLCDLMHLIAFNNLCDLKLLSCDFFCDRVRDVLEVKGCNLTQLNLEHVDQIDMNALMYISQFCPDLKILIIYNCDLVDSTSLYTSRLAIPPFMNLERLTIAAQCRIKHLEFLLSSCFKIKFIHFGTMVTTNDYLIDSVMERNPMEYLEEFRIIFSDQLTIRSAYKIAECCPVLTKLSELDSWTKIKPFELETFKVFIKERNYDLDVKSSGKYEF